MKKEEDKYVNVKALVQKDNFGGLLKMSGVCFDITEMKRGAEQVMFDLNEELLRSNNELEQYAYVASHDLQEPLRMISNNGAMLPLWQDRPLYKRDNQFRDKRSLCCHDRP
ncbi:MAG: hypothetical protein NT001_02245 [Candidatus Woesearchaeota archaeon]|nr:hypothetical protein [Candidatus Woesearchaeota archaeon]